MNPEIILRLKFGYMRPLNRVDVHKEYVDGLNSPDVNKFLDSVKSQKQTIESVISFVEADSVSCNSVLWGIWINGVEKHIGTVRIHGIELRHKTAHIGLCIFDKKFWGRGIGTDAIRVATNWAYDKYKLRWIEAGVFEENNASKRSFMAAGYELMHTVHGKYLLDGKDADVRIFAARFANN